MAVVEARELKRTYRTTTGIFRRRAMDVEAVRGVSFAIESGELFGLLGPNGAVKTTTIKMLITLLIPTGIAAAREVAAGATLASVSGLVWTEVAVGTAWALIAVTLVWWFEREGRRRASLETF